MAKETVAARFVFRIVSDVDPEQATGPAPTIQNDAVKKRLIPRGNDQRVIFIGFLLPGSSPMQDQGLESHFPEARADVVSVIGADPAFFDADMDQIIMNRRISSYAVVFRTLARRAMSRLR